MFRFSLRWLLAAVAFVGLAITALIRPAPLWAGLILLIASCLFLWSLLAVVVWRGQQQAAAVGFVLFGTVYLLGAWALGNSFPVTQVLHDLHPQSMSSDEQLAESESVMAGLFAERELYAKQYGTDSARYQRMEQRIETFHRDLREKRAGAAFFQSGHGVAMLVFAWLGWISGMLVYARRYDFHGQRSG